MELSILMNGSPFIRLQTMEYMALATGIRVALLSGMTGSAIMEYSSEYSKCINGMNIGIWKQEDLR